MDFARKISNRIVFMADGGICEEGTPKQIFDNPQQDKTRRFIHRLSTLTYKIDDDEFDFEPVIDELQAYAEKLLIENDRVSKLQIAIEEICVNNILHYSDNPDIAIKIEYSEKKDTLSMDIVYKGEHFDPKDSDNELFCQMLEEKTTVFADEVNPQAENGYVNHFSLSLKWEDQ